MNGAGLLTPPAPSVRPVTVWCECTIGGAPSNTAAREWLLDGYAAPSPRLAMRWFDVWAPRLADRIDPPLDAVWLEGPHKVGAVRVVTHDPADPVAPLRAWPYDIEEHEQALTALCDGTVYRLAVTDRHGCYSLSARPLLTHAGLHGPAPYAPAPCRGRPVAASPTLPDNPRQGRGSTPHPPVTGCEGTSQ
ncbi:hypothetical protein ABT390_13455 [Streptomyces aurantiacus]|uniref:Uncharacterized protein n=1 Tax=Streptomyces aurantiacus JA 4570 TaxID=1286094 RepID=S3ZB18_9ACTN|nr:hypothetical protein [Streptomyces aurantiacus]EPH40323.1 hypothetical protein STRAU_6586 [Streptomyces aurantiacus JA 4570]